VRKFESNEKHISHPAFPRWVGQDCIFRLYLFANNTYFCQLAKESMKPFLKLEGKVKIKIFIQCVWEYSWTQLGSRFTMMLPYRVKVPSCSYIAYTIHPFYCFKWKDWTYVGFENRIFYFKIHLLSHSSTLCFENRTSYRNMNILQFRIHSKLKWKSNPRISGCLEFWIYLSACK
jgi:hypothetical protein